MDDKLTSTFLRVCQEGSIRAVAIALEQEPSTISRRLTALETEIGIQLLERRKKGVKPTEAGELLLRHLRGQAAEFEALTAEFDALRGMRRGHVSLAVGEGFISDLIKNALPSFKKVYPGITFTMRSGSTEVVVQDIQNDVAHLGFVFNSMPDRQCKVLAHTAQPLQLLANPTSEWARTVAPVSIGSLAAMPLALLSSGSGLGAMVREVETIYSVRLHRALEANSLATIRNFVREGLGVTVLPAFVVAQEIADGTIVDLPLDVPEFARGEVSLIARSGRRLPEVAMKLANHAMRSMRAFQA
ncbi:DNA-binding transcriptional regulator, LysR family [Epibacterium ulvae]|uniref:DNA-binding transcriptional regulator, LysR family n=1 Tax=Epibacterium ulvae TaxID=1156985 RepID=A0A1G5RKB8_9RHOB|nr:LysR family transcriptional regulator [Epibacterium ulvae]SCZ74260.1 DNA-binding transcriptional regulator, LysR family [Epibacterium ulvae]